MSAPLLDLQGVETCYGLSQVLFGMSLSIGKGEVVTLLGRNGMGKTTTVRSVLGLTPARAGVIRFAGRDVRGLESFLLAQKRLGTYCLGDAFTMADVCLVPQVFNAERFGCDLSPYPTVMRLYNACLELPAVQAAHPSKQADAF